MLSRKEKQVGVLNSAERGKIKKIIYAINAVGNFVSPFFIFFLKIIKWIADLLVRLDFAKRTNG